jgi:hypothetical protein
VAEGEDLGGQVAARSQEGEAGEDQGADEVHQGQRPLPCLDQTSTILGWTRFSGPTGYCKGRGALGAARGSTGTVVCSAKAMWSSIIESSPQSAHPL